MRRSTDVSRPPDRLTNYVMLTDAGEPSCYKEAMLASGHAKWEHAMQSELDSIHKNGTWDFVTLPKDRKVLPCKWVYKYKYTSNKTSPKYKARLVAKAYKQEQGVDFDQIFSPIVKVTTLCMLLALATNQDSIELAKPLSTPLPTYVKLSTCDFPTSYEDKEFMTMVPYQFAILSLM